MNPDQFERSIEACPSCGAHRLALVEFPDVQAVGYQAYSEIMGVGELREPRAPAIGCLACGAEWSDLAAFREDRRSAGG